MSNQLMTRPTPSKKYLFRLDTLALQATRRTEDCRVLARGKRIETILSSDHAPASSLIFPKDDSDA